LNFKSQWYYISETRKAPGKNKSEQVAFFC